MQSEIDHGAGGDALADVLRHGGLQGRMFCRTTLSPPWSLAIPADRLAHFHHAERGGFRLRVEGLPEPWVVGPGETVVLPHGAGHVLDDGSGAAPQAIGDLVGGLSRGRGCTIVGGRIGDHDGDRDGGAGETRLLCGSFRFRPGFDDLVLGHLPPALVLGGGDDRARDVLRLIAAEVRGARPGAALVLARLVEVLFVQVVRNWLDRAGPIAPSWLAGLGDDRLASALDAMHGDPGRRWTVDALARACGMSRSAFAARFVAAVGSSPLAYLKAWRIRLAQEQLAEGRASIGEVARSVGYTTEPGFHNAFKDVTGMTPGAWRREAGSAVSSPEGGFTRVDERAGRIP